MRDAVPVHEGNVGGQPIVVVDNVREVRARLVAAVLGRRVRRARKRGRDDDVWHVKKKSVDPRHVLGPARDDDGMFGTATRRSAHARGCCVLAPQRRSALGRRWRRRRRHHLSVHPEDDAKEGDHKQSGQAHNGAAAQRFDGACVNEGMK